MVAMLTLSDYARINEKRALKFFVIVGSIFTVIGIWKFKLNDFWNVDYKTWALLGALPIIAYYLVIKERMQVIQSEVTGKKCTLLNVKLKYITDKNLIKKYKIVKYIGIFYIAFIVVLYLLLHENH